MDNEEPSACKRPDIHVERASRMGLGWQYRHVALRGSHDIDLRIGVPEADAIVIHCRVWADGNDLRVASRTD